MGVAGGHMGGSAVGLQGEGRVPGAPPISPINSSSKGGALPPPGGGGGAGEGAGGDGKGGQSSLAAALASALTDNPWGY